jgi:RNA recognition motif-containing protein
MIALQALNLSLSSYANFQPPPPPTPPPPPLPMMPQAPNVKDCRIYVGSLHYELKEAEIKMLFSSFGTIRTIDMSLEPGTGKKERN